MSDKAKLGRRDLLKTTAIAGAGLVIGSRMARADDDEGKAGGKRRSHQHRITGVLAPVITPFRADLKPDARRLTRHCKWLLSHGCSALAIFGTNSEANSMSVEERVDLLYSVVEGGVDPGNLMPGNGTCALPDTVQLTRAMVGVGCSGVLMLPPFYYKPVPEDGLFRSFAEVIERVGDSSLRIYLYHIPQNTGVPITLSLIERLIKAYPGIVVGIKDSGGNWANTQMILNAVGSVFDVFVGSEQFLLQNMQNGGVGCISATANVNPGAIDYLFRNWQLPNAQALQDGLNSVRFTFQKFPYMIPALKYAVAHYGNDPKWLTVRPPYVNMTPDLGEQLISQLDALGFSMPGLWPR